VIKVTIEKVTKTKYTKNTNYIAKSTPTEIYEKDGYGGGSTKVKCEEEYIVLPEEMERTETLKLYEQVIEDDELFDITRVISAVNEAPWTDEMHRRGVEGD